MLATTTRPPVPPQRRHPDTEAAALASYALVQQAQAGDQAAFGLIYGRYADVVFRFIYFRVGSRPLAEDLTADTFLRALKRIGSFTWQGRDLGAWLVTIARNLVVDHFKSVRYRLERLSDGEDHVELAEWDRDAADVVIEQGLSAAIRAALGQLTAEQRRVIVCRFLHGLSVLETAAAVGISEGACKAVQYRAVRALARVPGLAAWR